MNINVRGIITAVLAIAASDAFAPSVYARKVDVSAEIKNLKGADYRKKSVAITNLSGEKKNPEALNEIVNVIRTEKKSEIRSAAVIAAGNIGGTAAVGPLIEVLNNESEDISVRLDAVEGLSRMRDSATAFDALVRAAENPNPVIRRVSAGLLWRNHYPMRKDVLEPILKRMLDDTDEQARESAKQLLERKP
ncbi:MAG: HEAT repeat domain-containing protein [Endomicrobiia bacterium]|nr:HEAT repeat domain-containing protein [Endomicrobiia bacterium]